jgi:hypothetical protein
LFGDPFINAFTRKRTVGNDAVPFTVLFGDRTERGDGNREGEELPVKGAKKAAVGQFLLYISPDIVDMVDGRRMVPGSTGGMRRPDDANIPAIHNSFNDRKKVPVVPEIFGPNNRLEVGGDGDPNAVLVCPTRLDNLEDEFQALVDEVDAGTERPLTTSARRRT